MARRGAYVRLTNEQKERVRQQQDAHPDSTISELGDWAATAFGLARSPSQMTVRRALQHPEKTLRATVKTNRPVASAKLEEQLLAWILKCEELKISLVTGSTIREKAARLRDKMTADPNMQTSTSLTSLTFSNGWLWKFQKRHALTSKRVHGEAASVDAVAVENGRVALQPVTAGYAMRDVFNVDETAYFYCAPPKTTISGSAIAGRKAAKKRMTVAVACNADGSSKLPLLFVGLSRQPRCFAGKSAKELGIEYASTPKGWMNTSLFQSWVSQLNTDMQKQKRNILLLLDNASSHRVDEPLSNVTLHKLPPNTTSVLQPQDAGIIRRFKGLLSKHQTRYAVDRIDWMLERAEKENRVCDSKEIDSLYTVDVLTAMRWTQEAWVQVTASTIRNCWRHTQVLDEDVYELIARVEKITMNDL